jgi:hypothetical protein
VQANAAEQGAFNAETMRLVGANLLEASAKISAVRLEKGYDGRKAVLDHWRARLGLPPHTGWNLSKVLSALADAQADKTDDAQVVAASDVNLRLKPAPGEVSTTAAHRVSRRRRYSGEDPTPGEVSTAAAHPNQPVSQRPAPVLTETELRETTKNLEAAAAELETVERELRTAEVEREQLLQLLLQQRQMAYAKLQDRQQRDLRQMEIALNAASSALREEENVSTSMLVSDIDSRKRQLMAVSERVRDSKISTMPYVKSVVSAEPSSDTVTRGSFKFVIMAAFGGLMAGAFIALIREIVRKADTNAKAGA